MIDMLLMFCGEKCLFQECLDRSDCLSIKTFFIVVPSNIQKLYIQILWLWCHCLFIVLGYVGQKCEHACNPATDCNSHGICSETGQCVCDPCYDGKDCKLKCSGNGQCLSGVCQCNPCYIGEYCHSMCSGRGSCSNNSCACIESWRGSFCDRPGCPGVTDCSGHGVCNSRHHICYCDPGWTGRDCNTPDCPGEPDCYGRGTCVEQIGTAVCVNCTRYDLM